MNKKNNRKKTVWILLLVIIISGAAMKYYLDNKDAGDDQSDPHVVAEIGTVVEKALATGTIEPQNEIEIKSKLSGVVTTFFAEPGDYVRKGDPLMEVSPDPTPLELVEAKRNLERSLNEEDNLSRELERMRVLNQRNLISDQEFENLQQQYNDVTVRTQIDRERLELLESGRIMIGDALIESIIRAPIDGFILEKMIEIGEPVVPLTSYQAGTPLMTIAEMDNLEFKGTLDEIDVGKVTEGMPAEIKIGALTDVTILGEVSRISLKAQQVENATVFPIEIAITEMNGATLRAGYSANADIIIERKEEILTIPERVITMRDDRYYIEVAGSEEGERIEKEIEVGLSDAITIEVISGVSEGDEILERQPRTLTIR